MQLDYKTTLNNVIILFLIQIIKNFILIKFIQLFYCYLLNLQHNIMNNNIKFIEDVFILILFINVNDNIQ